MPLPESKQMLLQFAPLHGQFHKMVASPYISGIVHEEQEQICSQMYEFVGGDLKFDLVIACHIVYFYYLLLWLILVPGECIALLLVTTDTTHFRIQRQKYQYSPKFAAILVSLLHSILILLLGSINVLYLEEEYDNQYLLLKYQMFCSNNNGSALLLAWVNQELAHQGSKHVFYDYSHLKNSDFVYQLYQKINQTYFEELNHLNFDAASYMKVLQEYLIEVQGKKLTRCLKKNIVEQQSIQELIKIGLFLILQGNQKEQYINRIVQMNVEVQTYLMEELKRIQDNIQNFVEIKDILSTVQKLQEENELLKEKIKGCNEVNLQLTELVNQTKQENSKIQKEVSKYQTEKKQIFQELQIIDLKEYVQLYKSIKHQNEELNCYVMELDEKRKEAQAENKVLKQKITEDCQTINTLSDQVISMKLNFTAMKMEMSTINTSCCHSVDIVEDNALRQNKNFGNIRMRQSVETSCTERNNTFLKHLQEDEQNERLRNYNHEIMNKLQFAYKSITDLSNEVTTLKQEKAKLQKKNMHLQRKMGDLKKQQMRFMKELKQMGF